MSFNVNNNLSVCNTLFQHHPRRQYAWTSPVDRVRNQIDCILVRQRWRTSVMDSKTYPGADCGRDHIMLYMKMWIKLKLIKKKTLREIRLTDKTSLKEFGERIRPKLQRLTEEEAAPKIWDKM